jgi:hypothetical protein
MPRPHSTPGKDLEPIVQEAGGTRAGLDRCGKSPNGIRSPDRPARSQSLYRLSYPAHSREVPGRKPVTTDNNNNAPLHFNICKEIGVKLDNRH